MIPRPLAGPSPVAASNAVVLDLGGESLRVTPPDIEGLERREDTDDQLKAWWTALPLAVAMPSHAWAQQAVHAASAEPSIEFTGGNGMRIFIHAKPPTFC